jgi:hypothetical protein
MFLRTTSETTTLLLILLEGLVALLLKVGILLDTHLPFGLVGVEVLMYHIGN